MPQIDYTQLDEHTRIELPNDIPEIEPKYAGFWVRSWAVSIDSSIILVGVLILLLIAGSFIKSQNFGEQFSKFVMDFLTSKVNEAQNLPADATQDQAISAFSDILKSIDNSIMMVILPIQIIFSAFYYAIPESSSWQGSIGKYLMKIKIVDLNFERISFWRAFARNLMKILPGAIHFLISLAIFITIPFDKRKRGIHDMVCKTLVVYK